MIECLHGGMYRMQYWTTVYIHMHMYILIYIYIYIYIFNYIYFCMCVSDCSLWHCCQGVRAHAKVCHCQKLLQDSQFAWRRQLHTYMHAYIQEYIHTCTHTCEGIYIHVHSSTCISTSHCFICQTEITLTITGVS